MAQSRALLALESTWAGAAMFVGVIGLFVGVGPSHTLLYRGGVMTWIPVTPFTFPVVVWAAGAQAF
jgi:hypothetical protein